MQIIPRCMSRGIRGQLRLGCTRGSIANHLISKAAHASRGIHHSYFQTEHCFWWHEIASSSPWTGATTGTTYGLRPCCTCLNPSKAQISWVVNTFQFLRLCASASHGSALVFKIHGCGHNVHACTPASSRVPDLNWTRHFQYCNI